MFSGMSKDIFLQSLTLTWYTHTAYTSGYGLVYLPLQRHKLKKKTHKNFRKDRYAMTWMEDKKTVFCFIYEWSSTDTFLI